MQFAELGNTCIWNWIAIRQLGTTGDLRPGPVRTAHPQLPFSSSALLQSRPVDAAIQLLTNLLHHNLVLVGWSHSQQGVVVMASPPSDSGSQAVHPDFASTSDRPFGITEDPDQIEGTDQHGP